MTTENTRQSSRNKIWYWALALGVIALGIAIALLWPRLQPHGSPQPQAAPTMPAAGTLPEMVSLTNEAMTRSGISVVPVEERAFTSEISTVGVIAIPEPTQRTIAARARGRIEHMFVSATGAYVHKGEPLFEFYSPDILSAEKDYLIAIGADKNGQHQMSGMEQHSNDGLVQADRQRLELFGLTAEQIQELGTTGTVRSTISVRAPVDGLVLQKLAQEGAYVDEGSTIFQLADLSSVWAEINVPEQFIRFVHLGQSIQIHAEAYPSERFAGKVILISPIEDQASRTIRVRLSLPNPSYKLRPQMTFSTTLRAELGRGLAIPQSAVVRTGTGDYVWVADSGNMFTRKQVELGILSPDNYYQVASGLSSGDKIAGNGAFLVDAEHELTKSNPMAGMNMGESGNKNSGEGVGVVRRINTQEQTITLDHGNIPGVMAAMTMAYKVADAKFLQSVAVNETVRFTLTRMEGGEFEITAIEKP